MKYYKPVSKRCILNKSEVSSLLKKLESIPLSDLIRDADLANVTFKLHKFSNKHKSGI